MTMNKKDDITYLGIDDTPEKPQEPLKRKDKKPKFKANRHSLKLDRMIAKTRGIKISKKLIILCIIILLIIVLKPIKFLQDTLEKKRAYYQMVQEYNTNGLNINIDIDIDFENLWDKFVFATGEEYYKNCKRTMLMPVDGYITCHYDFTHMGIDIQSKTYPGTVYAAANGTICYVGTDKKYGNAVMIDHIINGMKLYTYYGNLSNIYVSVGQAVYTSTAIGTEAGTSENKTISVDGTDHHVHFAVRKNMKESSGLNPIIFLKDR